MTPIPDPPRESTPLLSSSALVDTASPSFRRLRSSVRPSIKADECAQPVEGLAPLCPGGIRAYDDRKFVPYREASLVKSMSAVTPYRRKARHRDYRLYWINVSLSFRGMKDCVLSILLLTTNMNLMDFTLHDSNSVTGGNHHVYSSVSPACTYSPMIRIGRRKSSSSIPNDTTPYASLSNFPNDWDRVDPCGSF